MNTNLHRLMFVVRSDRWRSGLSCLALAFSIGCGLFFLNSRATAADLSVGYQQIYNPWKVAILDGTFEAITGYQIDWRGYDSGAGVIEALERGEIQIGLAGSSPIAAGVSKGLDASVFWVAANINDAEALIVREGAAIRSPQDLRGKKIGVPFGSTTHFHLLFALEQFGIAPDELTIIDMQPTAIVANWTRSEIDAAFVWEPALGQLKQSGTVLISSGLLSSWGRATFDGLLVKNDFSDANRLFMCQFVQTLARADAAYRGAPQQFDPNSSNAQKIAGLVGGRPEDVADVLKLYEFPDLASQTSALWLGGGDEGGVANALGHTSQFLSQQGEIGAALEDYATVVRASHAEDALGECMFES